MKIATHIFDELMYPRCPAQGLVLNTYLLYVFVGNAGDIASHQEKNRKQ